MMKRLAAFVTLIFLAGGSLAASADEGTPTEARQVTVRLREYRFEPSEIILEKGEEVALILINDGTVLHEFITEAVQNLDVDVQVNGVEVETLGVAELEIPPKGKVVLRFTPEKAGVFPFACHAKKPKDHFKEGMFGKLVIR
jgi:uncharacterized cupredoxin-like copper-binding protein